MICEEVRLMPVKIKIISTRYNVEVKIRRPRWQRFISY